jgi:hypothetical protein
MTWDVDSSNKILVRKFARVGSGNEGSLIMVCPRQPKGLAVSSCLLNSHCERENRPSSPARRNANFVDGNNAANLNWSATPEHKFGNDCRGRLPARTWDCGSTTPQILDRWLMTAGLKLAFRVHPKHATTQVREHQEQLSTALQENNNANVMD